MLDSFVRLILFISGAFFLIFMIGFISRRRFKQRLEAHWGNRKRFAKADSEASLYESMLLDMDLQHYDSLIDDQTWNDLDLEAIFQEIDAAAQSSLGSEYLYSKLRLQRFTYRNILKSVYSYNFYLPS